MAERELLIAEDDQMLASLLHYRLEREGYKVNISYDGRAVKQELQNAIPDLIICDIMMPYLSGIELVDYVRNELKSEVPIILISSASNDQNVVNAFELGANDFIAKPMSPSELIVRISREIKRHYCS